jgi:four helix bundle protein
MAASFEDLKVWQKARELANLIYATTRQGEFARDYGLADQIRRAAVSVLSNIAEGFERGSYAEFIQFLYIAKGSCGEVRAQLYIARDQKYLLESTFQRCHALAVEVSRMLSGLADHLKSSHRRGDKFRRPQPKPWAEQVKELMGELTKE